MIEPLFRYHTSNLISAHQWQKSHFLRQKALTYFSPSQLNPWNIFFIPRIQTQVCTVSALNVLSLIVEVPKDEQHFQLSEGTGIEALKNKIVEIRALQGEKGVAFHCKLLGEIEGHKGSLHEFVIEVAPSGEIYLYQSYVNKYDLYEGMHIPQFGPWAIEHLIENLSLVVSEKSEWTAARNQAYQNLFNVDDEKLGQLELTFISVEYDPNTIPTVPQRIGLKERVTILWNSAMEVVEPYID